MAFRRGRFGEGQLTGRMAELEVLGPMEGGVEWKEWVENHEWMSDEDAYRQVLESQPCDPTEPKAEFASNLHAYVTAILEQVGLSETEDIKSRLRFYTAVGSYLDYAKHLAVDGFFDFEIEDGEPPIRVLLSVSTYEKDIAEYNQKGGKKIPIIYPESLDVSIPEDQVKWDDLIREVSTDIASDILTKVNDRNNNREGKEIAV